MLIILKNSYLFSDKFIKILKRFSVIKWPMKNKKLFNSHLYTEIYLMVLPLFLEEFIKKFL